MQLRLRIRNDTIRTPIVRPIKRVPASTRTAIKSIIRINSNNITNRTQLNSAIGNTAVLKRMISIARALSTPIASQTIKRNRITARILYKMLRPSLRITNQHTRIALTCANNTIIILTRKDVRDLSLLVVLMRICRAVERICSRVPLNNLNLRQIGHAIGDSYPVTLNRHFSNLLSGIQINTVNGNSSIVAFLSSLRFITIVISSSFTILVVNLRVNLSNIIMVLLRLTDIRRRVAISNLTVNRLHILIHISTRDHNGYKYISNNGLVVLGLSNREILRRNIRYKLYLINSVIHRRQVNNLRTSISNLQLV